MWRRAAREVPMTESTGYRVSYQTVDYAEEQNERARWGMEQLHGTVNTGVKNENDVQDCSAASGASWKRPPMWRTHCAKETKKRADS